MSKRIVPAALLSIALGCGASTSRRHVLVEADVEPGPGRDTRVEIEYADALRPMQTIYPGVEPIPMEHVCTTPCSVHVPPGPVAFSARGRIFEATASPPGTRFTVHSRNTYLDVAGTLTAGAGMTALVLAAIALPATDFGSSSSLDGTEIAVIASATGGLALSGLGLTIVLVWARERVEVAPLASSE